MCGIAGFFGNFDESLLRAMGQTVAHRGPDDGGTWFEPTYRVGFAHRRLSIIDLSPLGHQPMWDVERRACIVFNGEIFNYRQLARELRRDGVKFCGASDTEVLLNLFLRDGERFLEKLNGMFALAIWDNASRRLLVARDGMGVKPFYYATTPDGFAFASELKALMRVPGIDRTLDLEAISHYLCYLYCPGPRTPILGVRKLASGTATWVEEGKLGKSWRFWRRPAGGEPLQGSVADLSEQLEVLLARAVRRQMIADVPVGAFLSGGLDSSSLAVFARQYAAGCRLDCFTIGMENSPDSDGFPDDLPYAQKVAKHLGLPLHIVWSGSEIAGDFEQMVYQLDEPQPDPAAFNVLQISRLARQSGVTVLLSGAGGDDLFSGYRRHQALALEPLWEWLPRRGRSILQELSSLKNRRTSLGRRLAKAFQYAAADKSRRIAGYFAWLPEAEILSLFAPDFRSALQDSDPLRPLLAELAALPSGLSPLDRMLQLDQAFFLTDHNLNYTDKMAMAAGVEVRVPFLDPELMEFAARLPVGMKQNGFVGKWLLRKTMEVHLPHDVIYRPKAGFGAPLRHWMQHELKDHFRSALSREVLARRGLFDPVAVEALVERDRRGQLDAAYPLFGLVCIETWCRRFLDSNAP